MLFTFFKSTPPSEEECENPVMEVEAGKAGSLQPKSTVIEMAALMGESSQPKSSVMEMVALLGERSQTKSSVMEMVVLGESSQTKSSVMEMVVLGESSQTKSSVIEMDAVDEKPEPENAEMCFLQQLKEILNCKNVEDFEKLIIIKEYCDRYLPGDVMKNLYENIDIFLNQIIEATKMAPAWSTKIEDFWKTMFEMNIHKKIPLQSLPFVGRLIQNGVIEVLWLLMNGSYGWNSLHCGPNAETPLHYLCAQSWQGKEELYVKCMAWLLCVPHVNALNGDFKTPFDLAEEMGNEKAKDMLEQTEKLNANSRKGDLRKLFEDSDWEKQVKNLKPFSFSETFSCLKIIKTRPDCRELNQRKVIEVINNTRSFEESQMEEDELWTILLQEATREKLLRVVKCLLGKGADPCKKLEWNDDLTAIDIAKKLDFFPVWPLFWERDNGEKHWEISERILSYRDEDNNTILHIASKNGCSKAMTRILESSGLALIVAKNQLGEVPLIPSVVLQTGVLTTFLDSKVINPVWEPNKGGGRNWLLVEDNRSLRSSLTIKGESAELVFLDLEFLSDSEEDGDFNFGMGNLMEMSKNKIYHQYLVHPVLEIFVSYRWTRLKWLFYLNLLFSVLLTSCLSYNIVWAKCDMHICLRLLQRLLIFLLFVREAMQIYFQREEYIKLEQYENYIELLIIASGGYLSIVGSNDRLSLNVGAFVILLTWLQLMLLIGKSPLCAVQIEMYLRVFTTFVKYLIVYCIMIVAFAMTFLLLFKPNNDVTGSEACNSNNTKFIGIGESIFRSMVMIGGEFDASNICFDNFPGTSHVVFILFVFTVVIVLLNLLNGLAVHDTQQIKENASAYTFIARLRYLALLDKFPECLPNVLTRALSCLDGCCHSSGKHNGVVDIFYSLYDEDLWRKLQDIIFERQRGKASESVSKVGKIERDFVVKEITGVKMGIREVQRSLEQLTNEVKRKNSNETH